MANVIDALVVTLGLDAKGYTTGQKQASKALKDTGSEASRVAKDMEAKGKQAAMFFSKLRNEALGLLAIFTAGVGIKNFVVDTVTSSASLGRLSENLGLATEKLSAYRLANQLAGGTAAGMDAQLKESALESAKMKRGQGSASAEAFYALGGDPKALKDGNTFMLARMKIVSDIYKIDVAAGALAAQQMGISEDTFNLAKHGPEAFQAKVAELEKLSKFTKEDSAQAEILRQKFILLNESFQLTSSKIVTALMPAFESLIGQFQNLADWLLLNKDDIVAFFKDISAGIESVSYIAGPILKLIAEGWKNIFDWVTAAGKAVNNFMPTSWSDAIGKNVSKVVDWFRKMNGEAPMTPPEKKAPSRSVSGKVTDNTTSSNPDTKKLFRDLEAKNGIPFGALDSMWQQESGRGKNMLSPAGAKGHFQFMDKTAKQYGVTDPNDLTQSATGAAKMMGELIKQSGGDFGMALAKYNFGQGNVARTGMGRLPNETQNYLSQVQGRMGNAGRGSQGATSETTVNINGPIVTQAKDAPGISQAIGEEVGKKMNRMAFTAQANTGLQ